MFKGSGLILLVGIFGLNLMLISHLGSGYKWTDKDLYDYREYIAIGFTAPLAFIFYIRYFRVTNYDEVNNKFFKLNSAVRNRYHIAALFYIILSILSTLGYVIYNGGAGNGWW